MKLKTILLVALVLAFLMAPLTVTAQVGKCTKNCNAAEANQNQIPKMGQDKVNIILFGHFEDILNRAPLNTQPPDTNGREKDLNGGFMMPVVDTNVDPVAGHDPNFHFKNNEFIMFSSPGLVEYLDQGWRTHQEPGLASDAIIAEDKLTLYWYMSSYVIPGSNSYTGPARAGVMPQVGVYARMETGRFPFKGEVLAESAPHSLPGSGTKVNLITDPTKAEDVYEFEVTLDVKKKVIPADHAKNGFIVYVNPYQFQYDQASKPDKGVQLAQEQWRVRTGPNFPPRLIVPVTEPMLTVQSSLSTFDGRLFVRWSFKSVWGSYDMRDGDLISPGHQGLVFTKGKVDPKSVDHIITKRSVDHDGHFKPVNATWAIDYTNYRMEDGEYEIKVSIPNLQGSYVLTETFAFTVKGGMPQVNAVGGGAAGGGAQAGGAGSVKSGGDSPGFGAVFGTLAALAMAVIVRRRNA